MRVVRAAVRHRAATLGFVVAVLALACLAFWTLTVAQNADRTARLARQTAIQLRAEGHLRRDQTCAVFERQHLQTVDQLKATYRYLLSLTPTERATAFNRFVLAALPTTEARARGDIAPAYCYRPHVGLRDQHGHYVPRPVIPARPKSLR